MTDKRIAEIRERVEAEIKTLAGYPASDLDDTLCLLDEVERLRVEFSDAINNLRSRADLLEGALE